MLPLLAALAFQSPLGTVIDAKVTVDPAKVLGTFKPEALGVGVAVWDAHMVDAEIPKLVKDAGFRIIRYPGGSYADIYQWKTGTVTKGQQGTVQPNTNFDSFMAMCQKAAATPLITVNYGSNPEGTGGAEPSYAAEWVRYANKSKRYGVKYWEIGNEVYGNGFYNGRGWEFDLHAPMSNRPEDRLKNPLLGPTTYGKNVRAFAEAMKAVDPSVKIGAVLTTPGGWPDGIDPDWNTYVLSECGKAIDFVVIHWYGEGKTPEELFASLRTVPQLVAKARALVDRYCSPSTGIWMTEGDASGYNQRQAGALFAADHFMTWLESGAFHVDWWNLHNGLSIWQGSFGDQGILSSGHARQGIHQPPVNTPFPPYYGVQMVSWSASPGDQFLGVSSDRLYLRVHAVKQKSGAIVVMLINHDPDHPIRATVSVPGSGFEKLEYQRGWSGIRRSATKGNEVMVPAYGIVTLKAK